MTRPRTPLIAVDVIVEIGDPARIVLVRRRFPPEGWAIPGGFVDVGETLADAARRELREETSLDVELTELFGCYSRPDRDPRGHTISVIYLARATGAPRGGDDADETALFDPAAPPTLAFDHADILADYVEYRRTGRRPPLER